MTQTSIPPQNGAQSLRVLVVDDHEDMCAMLGMVMQKRQYAVKTALSGADALKMASDFAPHVVISDIGMPGMDGYQLMEHLRSTPEMGPFKSIALTGFDVSDEKERARHAGYDAHMTKPIEFDHLFEIIEKLAGEVQDG